MKRALVLGFAIVFTSPAARGVYRIVKAIVDHGRAFGDLHPGGADFTVDKTRFLVEHKLVPTAFHPGAERYWREHGVLR